MNIEEKARAYDEALEKARKHYNSKYHPSEGPSGVYLNNADLEEIFPVLKESEDERIRRALIEVSREVAQKQFFINRGTTLEDALAYLEKHKDSDKAMSAIEKIDKYIDTHIANAHDMDDSNPDKKYYQGRDNALGEIAGILQDVYSNEKQKEQKSSIVEKLREISTPADEDWFEIEKKWEAEDNEDLRPFISVKFASNAKVIDGKRFAVFTWERFKDIALELINRGKEKQKEQKPTEWSDDIIRKAVKEVGLTQHQINWFKTNVFPPKQEWSEEDEETLEKLHRLLVICRGEKKFIPEADYNKMDNLLKSLRPKPTEKINEEDKYHIERIISYLGTLQRINAPHNKPIIDEIEWLKAFRPNFYPHLGWKPSEEQMDALSDAYVEASTFKNGDILESLYNDLEKL